MRALAFACRRRLRAPQGVSSSLVLVVAALALGCATETQTAKAPTKPKTALAVTSALSCGEVTCTRPPEPDPTPPLTAYEPESALLPPQMTAAEALRLLGALDAPSDPTCTKWHTPLALSCGADEADAVEWVVNLAETRSLEQRRTESESLARLEGCRAFPKGALRWLRIRKLGRCGLELAAPALAKGGPDLDPTVRGLLAGEVIAEQCRRGVELMPIYRGAYTSERFAHWRTSTLAPWHRRMLDRLNACHEVAASLPVGAPGRAAALIGYAQAIARFVSTHRGSPIDKPLIQDHEALQAYLASLDEITAQFNELRNTAVEEARQEAAREGDYEGYARDFAPPVLLRHEPFSILGLPKLPRLRNTADERRLSRLPVQLLQLSAPYRPFEVVEYGAYEEWLSALLRRGLPQVIRAQLGATLATLSADDVARQRLHQLLAAGLLRLGLVTQDRASVQRAAYELEYAERNVSTAWLAAIARALLTPGKEKGIFPWFGYTAMHDRDGIADVNGFTPELLRLAATDPIYASLAVDHAVLRSVGAAPGHLAGDKLRHDAAELARRPGVPLPQRRCVYDWLAECGWQTTDGGIREGVRRPCDCTPFPWRVEEPGQ